MVKWLVPKVKGPVTMKRRKKISCHEKIKRLMIAMEIKTNGEA